MVKHVENWGHKERGRGLDPSVAHCSSQHLGKETMPKDERIGRSLWSCHLELAWFQKLSRVGPR